MISPGSIDDGRVIVTQYGLTDRESGLARPSNVRFSAAC
jgi:hypothetical protein